MRILYTLLLLVLLQSASAAVFFTHNLFNDNELGQGFDSDNDLARETCLNPSAPYKYYGKWVLDDVIKNTDTRDVAIQLGLNTGMGPSYAVYNDSKQQQYMRTISGDQYSQNFNYRTNIVLPSKNYLAPETGPALNDLGQTLLDKPQQFRNHCGNQYVHELYFQGMLYVTVQLHFFTAEDKEKADLDNYWDSKTLIQELPSHVQDLNPNGDMEINVFQLGGDTKKLDKLSSKLTCRFDDLTPCLKTLQKLLDYASSKTAADFIEQFPSSEANPIPKTAGINDVSAWGYSWIDIPVTPIPNKLTPEMKGTRIKIDMAFKPILGSLVRANYILNFKGLDKQYKAKLKKLNKALLFNRELYQQAGVICFTKLGDCVKHYQQVEKEVKPVDLKILDKPVLATN